MVWAREVDHLEVMELLLEVGRILECDGELNAPKMDDLDPMNDPKEGGPTGVEALPWDPHVIQRVGIEDIKATSPIHWRLHEAGPSDDGADNERQAA